MQNLMQKQLVIIGGGLAGCECALALARAGLPSTLYEQKPEAFSPAHVSEGLGELVCSNSFRSNDVQGSGVGLLKQEMRELGSEVMAIAETCSVPAGKALAVDREGYARMVTEHIKNHPNISLVEEEITEIPEGEVVIASGPLTSDALAEKIAEKCPDSDLHFYDAAAPIVMLDSIDMESAFYASRYDKGDADC